MQQEGEGRGTADTARESRQHEERAAGPAAQFTHHETASTQGTRTPPPPPVQSHGNGIRPQPAAGTQRTRSKQSPKEPHAEADPHPSTTRRLTPCGHTECTVSSIDLIRRPSLKDASVSDGP
ncbi:hypothetical protein TcCL_NonESM10098 [Trypanosoma cruzi]|nr:hypothetical protein TcCL_NonESM10098 [Trypanosoma cruzi]